jgi:molybdenum cofactor cytidylyltransferase
MNLAKALDLKGGMAVAFVGAGGKTSAMFTLGRELKSPVLLTTTTHLGVWQAAGADQHHIIEKTEDVDKINLKAATTVLLTGPAGADDRLASLDTALLQGVFQLCKTAGIPLLIEADGARGKPLKAHADYEPVIPAWVDQVVVVAGLSGLGEQLTANHVHRPEIFAQLGNLNLGDMIEAEHLSAVLSSDSGGLKGIPPGAKKVLLLNQADNDVRKAQGARLAGELTEFYDRVLVGSLQQPGQAGPIFSADSRTTGIILAAGGSTRLGTSKQLLHWQGKPFVVNVAEKALSAGLSPLIVVTGSEHSLIESALAGLPVKIVHNPDWALGQSTSMKAGLMALPSRCERVVFLLSDQPQVSPILIRALIERYNMKRAPITAPMTGDRRGNPILFGQETFDTLKTVEGDQGGRGVFSRFSVDKVLWVDRRVHYDVDEEGDLERLTQAFDPN